MEATHSPRMKMLTRVKVTTIQNSVERIRTH